MGVPRLFPWLLKTFPMCITHFQRGELITNVDYLYLDANGLLHNAAQLVYNYGQNKSKIDKYAYLKLEEKPKAVFEMFFNMIENVIGMVVPSKLLYIAIDGPAPLAKQAQQRQRRFVAAKERLSSTSDIPIFDSTSISPGTVFMLELTKYIHLKIRNEMQYNHLWREKGFRVIFSPPTVPGEGEHKIMDYIRTLPSEVLESEKHCLFGPDGDLIMLTLATHIPHMFLFRENQYEPDYYDLLDMGIVRNNLPIILNRRAETPKGLDDISNDFILAGFFVGNDFLPKIQMFTYLEDGLEMMISVYKGIKLPLSIDGNISYEGFTRFVEELGKREYIYIADQARIDHKDPKFKDETLLRHILPNGKLEIAGYRKDYYKKAGVTTEEEIKTMCLEYLHSFEWVFTYYIKGLKSWRDFYPKHYAPLMVDLVSVIKGLTPEDIQNLKKFDYGSPTLPFIQLISISPPTSAKLLPPPLNLLLTDSKSPLVKAGFYPNPLSLEIDYEGKTKEHMAVALLNFVDVDLVSREYNRVFSDNKIRYARNDVTKSELFVFDPKYLAKYESEYGKISKMNIRKIVD